MDVQVIDNEDPSGTLTYSVRLANESAQTVDLDLFHFVDADAASTFGGDSLSFVRPGYLRQNDSLDPSATVRYRAALSDHYKAGIFSAVKALLNDTDVDDFDDCCAVAGPGRRC